MISLHEETRQKYIKLKEECDALIKELEEIRKAKNIDAENEQIERVEKQLNQVKAAIDQIPWKYAKIFTTIQLEYVSGVLETLRQINAADEEQESEQGG